MPGLQAPLVPTRSGNSTPTPSASSTGASTPTLAGSSQPSPPVTLLNSPPAHNRVPSTTSSDDFGDFVASDPLRPSASTPPSTGATAGQAADLLQFSPVRETFLDGAARRVEERQKDLLGPLALLDAINRPGFDGLEQGFGGGERTAPVPVGGSHRRIPSNSGGTRYVLAFIRGQTALAKLRSIFYFAQAYPEPASPVFSHHVLLPAQHWPQLDQQSTKRILHLLRRAIGRDDTLHCRNLPPNLRTQGDQRGLLH